MFLAAYMFAKSNDKDLSDCIKFANLCSGEIIQKYGAKMDDNSQYQKLYQKL